ncbi:MAG: hypothetical protein Q9171_003582 [Xanthocarpia ochracea]
MSSSVQNSGIAPFDGHDTRTLPQHYSTTFSSNLDKPVTSDSDSEDWLQQELRNFGRNDARLRTFLADYNHYKNARLEGLFQSVVAASYFEPPSSSYYWGPTNMIGGDTERSQPSKSPTFSQTLDHFRAFLQGASLAVHAFAVLADEVKTKTSEDISLKLEWLAHAPRYKGMVSTYIWRPYIHPPETINAQIRISIDDQGSRNVLVHLWGWDHSEGALRRYNHNSFEGPSTHTRLFPDPERKTQLHLYAVLKQLIVDSNNFVKTAYEEIASLGEGLDEPLETWFGQALKDIGTLRDQLDEIETQILATRTMVQND